MGLWKQLVVVIVAFALTISDRAAVPALAVTKIDEFEAEIPLSYTSNVDDSTQKGTVKAGKLKPVLPLIFTATRTKGTATSSVNLNSAFLFDGSRLSGVFYPTTLLTQYQPKNNKPAEIKIQFNDFDLETEDNKPLEGFFINDFLLVGTVAPGGYVKVIVDLELDAEGPGTNIDDRHLKVNSTFTSNFSVSFASLFGPNGIFGTDLSNRKLEELELDGSIKFQVLGTKTGTTTLQIQ